MIYYDGEKMTITKVRCELCNMWTVPIEVAGHIQCEICKGNFQPCCQGETADEPCITTEGSEGRKGDL